MVIFEMEVMVIFEIEVKMYKFADIALKIAVFFGSGYYLSLYNVPWFAVLVFASCAANSTHIHYSVQYK